MTLAAVVLALAVAATSCKGVDADRAAALFTEVTIDTRPGLSGLAADDAGGLWTVAERAGASGGDGEAYRITLDAALAPTIEKLPVRGVPVQTDLEGIAWLGPGRFALGTEGHEDGVAMVLTAEQRDGALVVTGSVLLDGAAWGIALKRNQGAEGVCGAGETIIAAIEASGSHDGIRWAPIARVERGAIVRKHKLRLTTSTGKIAGIDCRIAADGTVTGWAIERHFEVTKVLRFALPPAGQGDELVIPEEALDLGPVLNSRLNLEGIAETTTGQVIAVIDNQWKAITGPSELLVFKPGVLKP